MLPVARLAAMTAAASVKVTPDVLVWAREHSAASLDEAVARTKHELAEVLDWEAGKADPPLTALRELANLYGVPLTVFMLDARPKVQPRPVDMRAFTGVTKPEPSLELAKALNRAAALQTLAHDLMEELGIPTTVTGPADQGDAEQLAATQRALVGVSLETQRKWKDERHALREWRAAIERRGVFVIQLSMKKAGSRKADVKAFSLSQQPPLIVLNQSDFVRSRVFSLIHEYAHVLLGTGAICLPGSGRRAMEQSPAVEVFCNRFAGAFLVPGDALKADALATQISKSRKVPDDATLEKLARRFHVSWAVVWYRLRHLDMISQAMFAKKWEDWDWYPMPGEGGGGMTHGERVMATYGTSLASLVLDASARNIVTTADVGQYLSFPAWRYADVETELSIRTAV